MGALACFRVLSIFFKGLGYLIGSYHFDICPKKAVIWNRCWINVVWFKVNFQHMPRGKNALVQVWYRCTLLVTYLYFLFRRNFKTERKYKNPQLKNSFSYKIQNLDVKKESKRKKKEILIIRCLYSVNVNLQGSDAIVGALDVPKLKSF